MFSACLKLKLVSEVLLSLAENSSRTTIGGPRDLLVMFLLPSGALKHFKLQILLNRYSKFYPMDELPPEYKVTESKPKPPLLTYGIPVDIDKVTAYGCKNESERPDAGKPVRRMFEMIVLSKHVQYPLRLGFPAMLATEYTAVVVLYTNYNMDKRQLVEEDEEDVISMVKEALELDEDVRPRWDFECGDPFVPILGQD
jgi:hypothetical protein